tara:strand:+ start:487 stop:2295 length:1809 start_codon:yes stop_codon:yes gene_type:complete
MSQLNVDNIKDRSGSTLGPTFPNGMRVAAGSTLNVYGDMVVEGTQTVINSDILDVKDKTVGIASTANPTALTQDGAGLEIYGPSNVTLTYSGQKGGIGINTGLTVTGVVTATSFTGDGAGLTGVTGFTATASGTIPANRSLAILPDGKVGVITGTKAEWGSYAKIGTTDIVANTGELVYGNGKVVALARRSSDNTGHCAVGTISGTTITWGDWATFEASNCDGIVRGVYDPNSDKFIVFWKNSSNTGAKVISVSGTTPSFGSVYAVSAGTLEGLECCMDTDTNQIAVHMKNSSNVANVYMVAISGTTLSWGTGVQVATSNSYAPGVTYDTKNNKVILGLGYDAGQSNNAWAYIGTVSGSSISIVSAGKMYYNTNQNRLNMHYNEERERIVVTSYNYNTNEMQSIVGKYVSATSITWGTITGIRQDTSNLHGTNELAYDPHNKSYVLMSYRTSSITTLYYYRGKINPADSSDPEVMTWTDEKILQTGYAGMLSLVQGGNSIIISGAIETPLNAYAKVEALRNSTLNGDGTNYVGYSDAAYTNGQTVNVKAVGTVVSGQVGLTTGSKYYAQGDGGLVSFIDNNLPTPSAPVAGVAIDSTKLLIK